MRRGKRNKEKTKERRKDGERKEKKIEIQEK